MKKNWWNLKNLAMKKELEKGAALDVREIGTEVGPGKYQLPKVVDGKDYCDSRTEAWIWSIGKRKTDGVILASTAADLYQNDDYECLWLR